MNNEIKKIIEQFDIKGNIKEISQIDTGNINKSYLITCLNDNQEIKYIFQRINTNVFREPYKLMKNIDNITRHISNALKKDKDKKHIPLKVILTKRGNNLFVLKDEVGLKQYFRLYNYIDNAISYDRSIDYDVVFNTGKAFGNFQKLLNNYPIEDLEDTIPDFHNTQKRYINFVKDIKLDSNNRADEVAKEILFLIKRSDSYNLINDLINTKKIPTRVAHNDTKVNNVMMNKKTGEFLTVIDLDTVMPGTSLFDYGDGIRSACSNALEDETNLDNVYLNLDLFKAYTDGYLSEMAHCLTKDEVNNMGNAIIILTLELGMRFLNDYINGDTYFKTNYEQHNLDRARNQFKLVCDIEGKLDIINDYINKSYIKYNKE